MSDESTTIPQMNAASTIGPNDLFVAVTNVSGNALTLKVTSNTLFNNSTFDITMGDSQSISVNTIHITKLTTPASSSATSNQGQIWFDGSYLYVATANNVIKRVTLDTF